MKRGETRAEEKTERQDQEGKDEGLHTKDAESERRTERERTLKTTSEQETEAYPRQTAGREGSKLRKRK